MIGFIIQWSHNSSQQTTATLINQTINEPINLIIRQSINRFKSISIYFKSRRIGAKNHINTFYCVFSNHCLYNETRDKYYQYTIYSPVTMQQMIYSVTVYRRKDHELKTFFFFTENFRQFIIFYEFDWLIIINTNSNFLAKTKFSLSAAIST